MRKSVSIVLQAFDPETGDPVGNHQATGYTDDEGVTVVVPAGYLPGIEAADPAHVSMVVNQPPVDLPVGGIARTVDEESGDQVLTITTA